MRHVLSSILVLGLLAACGETEEPAPTEASPTVESTPERVRQEATRLGEAAGRHAEEGWQHLGELYEASAEAGETAATNVYDWVLEDLRKVGAWDYRVERLAAGDDTALARRLSEWGDERWRVVWIQPVETSGAAPELRVFLERARRSRLQRIADRDYVELAPVHDESDSPARDR